MRDTPKIFPLGDGALTVDFGNEIALDLNDRAISLASQLNDESFDGFVEAVPAYSSVAVFYDLVSVRRSYPQFETAFDAVRGIVEAALERPHQASDTRLRQVEIPVDFSGAAALDLDIVAAHADMSPTDVVELFTAGTYRVYMLGFLPGFAYMGEVDERIAVPRKDSPRKKVPKGSVGIAGRQTGVYPLESPGGWQIIGRTDLAMYTPEGDSPCLLRPGDEVRFVNLES